MWARYIFLLAAALGSVFIVSGAYFNSRFITLVLPLLTMLVYMLLGKRLGLLHKGGPSYADSIYYLGFIFTLVALTSTLFSFDESNMKVEQLVSNFALALVTTIFGLTMRIYFNTFYYDVNVSRRSLMDALQKETEEFIAATHTVSLRLKGIESQAVGSIEKARNDSIAQMEEVNKSINEVLITSKSAIKDASEASLIGMEKVVDQSLQKINGFNIPEDLFTSKLDIPLNTLATEIQRINNLLDGLHEEQIRIKDSSKSVATSFVGINENLDSTNDSLLEFSKSLPKIKQSMENLPQLSNSLGDLDEKINTFSSTVSSSSEIYDSMLETLKSKANTVNDFQDQIRGALTKVTEDTDKITSYLLTSTKYIAERLK